MPGMAGRLMRGFGGLAAGDPIPVGDTTAPILSSPTGTQTGSTTANLGVTTNEANGTLYSFVSTSATPPSAADLKAGTGAVFANSQTITTTGAKTASASGLTASTAYYAHFLHRDAAGNDSAIATSASFTTASAGGATNLLSYSEQLDNASWTKSASSIAANSSLAPDGATTADTITASGTTTGVSKTFAASAAAFTYSKYLKAGTSTWARLAVSGVPGVGTASAWFNLATGELGTVQAGLTATIEPAAEGFYRCRISATLDGANPQTIYTRLASADNTTSGTNGSTLIAWGAMVETGASMSTYVPRAA